MICLVLKAIYVSGEFLVQPFISFVVSVIYFFVPTPVGSMNKFFFQKTIHSHAFWILVDTPLRFRSPDLMFVYFSLIISLAFWYCCYTVVLWRSFIALWLAGWLSVTVKSRVFLRQVWRCWFKYDMWKNFGLCKTKVVIFASIVSCVGIVIIGWWIFMIRGVWHFKVCSALLITRNCNWFASPE